MTCGVLRAGPEPEAGVDHGRVGRIKRLRVFDTPAGGYSESPLSSWRIAGRPSIRAKALSSDGSSRMRKMEKRADPEPALVQESNYATFLPASRERQRHVAAFRNQALLAARVLARASADQLRRRDPGSFPAVCCGRPSAPLG